MSAVVCISTNFITACIIFFFAYHAFTPDPVEADSDTVEVTPDGEQRLYTEARRRDLRSSNSRICRTPSPSPSNNSGRLPVKPVNARRNNSPEIRQSPSHFQPQQSPPSTRGRRLRSASFPPCRWDDVEAKTGKDMGAATRGASSTSCRGRQDLYSDIPMADIQGGVDCSGGYKDSSRGDERRSQVTTLQPLTYSNTNKSNQIRTDNVYDSKSLKEMKNGTRFDDGGSTSRDKKCDVTLAVLDGNTISGEGTRDEGIVKETDEPQTAHLEKSLSFDSGVQQILPAFTVFKANRATAKDAALTANNIPLDHQELYMRRIPDGAPAEPAHTQHSGLTRAKSEELCSPRDEEKTTVRKRSPGKTKSKFGSSFRKIIPRR